MPYIPVNERTDAMHHPVNSGQLNFAITMLLIYYWNHNKHCYQTINDITGACEGAKLEFTRRVTARYEDEKINSNSDVYPFIP